MGREGARGRGGGERRAPGVWLRVCARFVFFEDVWSSNAHIDKLRKGKGAELLDPTKPTSITYRPMPRAELERALGEAGLMGKRAWFHAAMLDCLYDQVRWACVWLLLALRAAAPPTVCLARVCVARSWRALTAAWGCRTGRGPAQSRRGPHPRQSRCSHASGAVWRCNRPTEACGDCARWHPRVLRSALQCS
jgi:hypothetical protein